MVLNLTCELEKSAETFGKMSSLRDVCTEGVLNPEQMSMIFPTDAEAFDRAFESYQQHKPARYGMYLGIDDSYEVEANR